jgi:SAM-dependent methyltransferase
MPVDDSPTYLLPYLRAAKSHGEGFQSLLWASPQTQEARFNAIRRIVDPNARTLLDAGCGRADLLDHLARHQVRPLDYVGIEAVDELAAAAERKQRASVRILRGDFIRQPVRLFVGAEIVIFCGSLNTVEDGPFFDTLRRAYDATAWALVFNFLSSPALAGASHLHWRPRGEIERFVQALKPREVRVLDDYLEGDCTMAVMKEDPHGA